MDPYNENSCLNIRMKWKRKNKFSGNIRITTEEDEIVFKVIDFTFFESKLVDSIIRSFEIYAFYIGVKYIIFSPGVLYNTYELVHEQLELLLKKTMFIIVGV